MVDIQAGKLVPFRAFRDVHLGSEYIHLRRVHQTRMVVFVARQRQSESFDRVGDKTIRLVVVDAVKGLENGLKVMASQVGHQ